MTRKLGLIAATFALTVFSQPTNAGEEEGVQDEQPSFETLRVAIQENSELAHDQVAAFVASHSGHREARLMLGRLQLLSDLPDETLRTLEPLLGTHAKHSHPDWQPWFWAGSARLAMDEIDAARDYLEVALSKNSSQAEVWVQLAVLEQEMSNHAGALQYLAIANQLAPDTAEIHLNRAYSLEHSGEYAQALKAYQRFVVSNAAENNRAIRPLVLRRISTLANFRSEIDAINKQHDRGGSNEP